MTGDGTTKGATGAPEPGSGGGVGAATEVHPADPAVEEYLEGVRAALVDLPAPEVAEIVDDVRAHLTDLTAESGGEADRAALTARLGPPSGYAAELRAAAGYPPAPEAAQSSRRGPARLALAGLVAATLLLPVALAAATPIGVLFALLPAGIGVFLIARDGPGAPAVAALPVVRRLAALRPATGTAARTVVDFLASLQPAWWVVRAFAAAFLLVIALGGGGAGGVAAVVITLFAAPVSIWLGHRSRSDRRWLWPVVPLNGIAAMVLFVLLAGESGGLGGPSASSVSPPVHRLGLWQDTHQILDIRPVDAAGNPLTGVYLFDQDGRPIDTSGGVGCDVRYGEGDPGRAADGGGVESNTPYPRGTWDYDRRTGDCRFTPPGPLVVAVPSTSTPGRPTAGPTQAPSAAGGPTAAPPTAGSAPGPRSAPPVPPPSPASPSTAPVTPVPPTS